MKICLVSLFDYNRGGGGIQTHCRWLIRYFDEQSIPYIYVSPFSYALASVYPVFALRYFLKPIFPHFSVRWFRFWHYYFLKKALAQIFRKEKIDVVHAQCPLSARAALEIKARDGYSYQVILSFAINGSQADEEADAGHITKNGSYYKKIKRMEEFVLSHVDKIVFISDYIKDRVLQEYPQAKELAHTVIYRGVGECAHPKDKNQGGNNPIKNRLVTIGTLEPRKNQSFLLEAVRVLAGRFPAIELRVIGEGEDLPRLMKRSRALGIVDKVHFLGYLPRSGERFEAGDIYVHASLEESLGTVFIEALACGIPAVALSVGGIPEVVQDGRTGFLAAPGDLEGFVRRIEELLRDPDLYARFRDNCLRLYRERFTYRQMGRSYLEFYFDDKVRA